MDIASIPFLRFLGLLAGAATLTLPGEPKYLNHLGTVHAGAQFALAEAASGQCLLDRFAEVASEYLAVVRHAEVKYRRPAVGELSTKAELAPEDSDRFLETLTRRGRASIEVRVQVLASDGAVTLEAAFEWFVQRRAAEGS